MTKEENEITFVRSNIMLGKGPNMGIQLQFFELLQATINNATDPSCDQECVY